MDSYRSRLNYFNYYHKLYFKNKKKIYFLVCGGIINKTRGKIESPGFPSSYPINRDCTWTLKTTLGRRFKIYFHTLQIENNTDCTHDYLSVRNF